LKKRNLDWLNCASKERKAGSHNLRTQGTIDEKESRLARVMEVKELMQARNSFL